MSFTTGAPWSRTKHGAMTCVYTSHPHPEEARSAVSKGRGQGPSGESIAVRRTASLRSPTGLHPSRRAQERARQGEVWNRNAPKGAGCLTIESEYRPASALRATARQPPLASPRGAVRACRAVAREASEGWLWLAMTLSGPQLIALWAARDSAILRMFPSARRRRKPLTGRMASQ